MRAGRTSILVFAVAVVLLAASLGPVHALTGTVTDRDQKPIRGARACYWVVETEQLCVVTDDGGYFELADGPSSRIRIFADGYLPRILPAVEQNGPIVMTRSATLFVIVDRRDHRRGNRRSDRRGRLRLGAAAPLRDQPGRRATEDPESGPRRRDGVRRGLHRERLEAGSAGGRRGSAAGDPHAAV